MGIADISFFENLNNNVAVRNDLWSWVSGDKSKMRGADVNRVGTDGNPGLAAILGPLDAAEEPLIYRKHFMDKGEWNRVGGENQSTIDAYRKMRGVGNNLRSLLKSLETSATYFLDSIDKQRQYFQERFHYQVEDILDYVAFIQHPAVRKRQNIKDADIGAIAAEVGGVFDDIYDHIRHSVLVPLLDDKADVVKKLAPSKSSFLQSLLPERLSRALDRAKFVKSLSADLSQTDREAAIQRWDDDYEGYAKEAENMNWLGAPSFELTPERQKRINFWMKMPDRTQLGKTGGYTDNDIINIFGKQQLQDFERTLSDRNLYRDPNGPPYSLMGVLKRIRQALKIKQPDKNGGGGGGNKKEKWNKKRKN